MTALPGAAQSPPVVQPSAPLTCKHHYNIEYIELFDLSGASISFSWSRVRSGPWRRWGTIVRMRQLLFPIHYWSVVQCVVSIFWRNDCVGVRVSVWVFHSHMDVSIVSKEYKMAIKVNLYLQTNIAEFIFVSLPPSSAFNFLLLPHGVVLV